MLPTNHSAPDPHAAHVAAEALAHARDAHRSAEAVALLLERSVAAAFRVESEQLVGLLDAVAKVTALALARLGPHSSPLDPSAFGTVRLRVVAAMALLEQAMRDVAVIETGVARGEELGRSEIGDLAKPAAALQHRATVLLELLEKRWNAAGYSSSPE